MPSSSITRSPLRNFWLTIGWLLVVLVLYLSLAPIGVVIPGQQGDKVGHCIAYASLMLWFAQIYVTFKGRRQLAVALLALGVGIEFIQYFLPYRSFDVLDMVADAGGIAIGWLAAVPRTPNFFELAERVLKRTSSS
jgi:VanZ family protein